MAKAKLIQTPPTLPPPPTVLLEMSLEEAAQLLAIIGAGGGSNGIYSALCSLQPVVNARERYRLIGEVRTGCSYGALRTEPISAETE